MCRFVLVRTTTSTKPQAILSKFSKMAELSRAPDGDIQGDGWGISWQEDDSWQRHASVKPIWESESTFSRFPKTKLFLAHARSASFEKDKNNVDYNQPYIKDDYAFVFNGLLKGMRFPRPLIGEIGAQKIWSLVQEHLEKNDTKTAVGKTAAELNKHAREIQALNFAVSDDKKFYVYSQFSGNDDYYTLHLHQSADLVIISSEPLEGFSFGSVEPKVVKTF